MLDKYDFYLASPFFNDEQRERETYIKNILRKKGYKVYAPIEEGVVKLNEKEEELNRIFNSNIKAINLSDKVIVITDGKDIGTIWEAGYAYALNKSIIYFAETLGNNPFNLMLAQSGIGIFKSRESFCNAVNKDDFYKKDEVFYE